MSGNAGMLALIVALVALLTAAVLAVTVKGKPATEPQNADKMVTTMKAVVWVSLTNGFAWVWCSYILAYLGRTEIAESLSKVAITEIIGVVLVYAVKSLLENLSKNNQWPDKPAAKKTTQQDCD